MKLYLSIIGIAAALISAVNIAVGVAAWYYVIAAVIWCIALQFALDGAVAIIIKATPDRWYGVNNPHFNVSDREKRLYIRLGVERWKDKVWELGGIGGFSKAALKDPFNPQYIEKFIIECNKGVLTHRLTYFVGFLVMLTMFNLCSLTIALPTAVVNVFLNVLPTVVLRHNTPKLKSIYERLNRRIARKSEAKQRQTAK